MEASKTIKRLRYQSYTNLPRTPRTEESTCLAMRFPSKLHALEPETEFLNDFSSSTPSLLICINERQDPTRPSCARRGSLKLAQAIEQGIVERGIALKIERIHCLGHCQKGPTMRLAPGGKFYLGNKDTEAETILDDIESRLKKSL